MYTGSSRVKRSAIARLHKPVILVLLLLGYRWAAASTINFESFPDTTPIPDGTQITNQFAGLTFFNTTVITGGITLNEVELPPHSGQNVAFDDGGPISISFNTPTSTFSGYFTYYEPVTLNAFDLSDTLIATATSAYSINVACDPGPLCLGDPGSSPNELLAVAFPGGISSVTISGDAAGDSLVMDDISYTTLAPEPPNSVSLLLIALVGLLATGKKESRLMKWRNILGAGTAIVILIICGFSLLAQTLHYPSTQHTSGGSALPPSDYVQAPRPGHSITPLVTSAMPSVGTLTVSPTTLVANSPKTVTVSVQISPVATANSVNLLQLGATATQPSILGVMHDDGLNGDAIAGDQIYSLQVTLLESAPGNLQLEASAAFPGSLKRVISPPIAVGVWGHITDAATGLTALYPPFLYNVTPANGPADEFTLSSSSTGINVGDTGSDPTLAPSGYQISVLTSPYNVLSFDLVKWAASVYPAEDIGAITPVTIGGSPGYTFEFTDGEGSGEPLAVVFHNSTVFQFIYTSTYPPSTSNDRAGQAAFETVISNITFSH